VTRILDAVIDEYEADRSIIFWDEKERKKYLYGALDDAAATWKRTRKCMVPSCSHKSIPRSHAVPRGMLADKVGEAGHVLAPHRDRRSGGQLALERVGLSDASTFPGFCSAHERLFESFENAKKVSTEDELLRQAYRTACRELFRTAHWIDKTTRQLQTFQQLRDERLTERVRSRLHSAGLQEVKVGQLQIQDDPIVSRWEQSLQGLRELHDHLKATLVPALESAVFSGDKSGLSVHATNLDVDLPVGLSGAASVPRFILGQNYSLHILMGVLPHDKGTLTFTVGAAADQAELDLYEKRWMQNALEYLSMVESWMINGSDQWYLRPSVWNKLGKQRQDLILAEISACARSVRDEAEHAIFDDVRRTFLADFEAVHTTRTDADYLDYVQKHRSKVGSI
jgi:hypothetical protein